MADGTHIEWTDATWNPITGCSVKSPGCKHCYAMLLAGTRLAGHPSRAGLTQDTAAGPVWTGEVRFNEEWLDQPLRWKRPRMIFVCAHGDLFHEDVPDEWIDQIFAVMALSPQHVFQVLTKRADRMRQWFASHQLMERIEAEIAGIVGERVDPLNRRSDDLRASAPIIEEVWPLHNVWLGVSVEDQARAHERIPDLLETPASVRWLSCEPLLEQVNLGIVQSRGSGVVRDALTGQGMHETSLEALPRIRGVDWVVAGGESGPSSRPMHADWVRSLRDQTVQAGVAFLFKQWGDHLPEGQLDVQGFGWAPGKDGKVHWWMPEPEYGAPLPDDACSVRIGKRQAGRRLDGAHHDGFPAARAVNFGGGVSHG